jgi:hypothetical protein
MEKSRRLVLPPCPFAGKELQGQCSLVLAFYTGMFNILHRIKPQDFHVRDLPLSPISTAKHNLLLKKWNCPLGSQHERSTLRDPTNSKNEKQPS